MWISGSAVDDEVLWVVSLVLGGAVVFFLRGDRQRRRRRAGHSGVRRDGVEGQVVSDNLHRVDLAAKHGVECKAPEERGAHGLHQDVRPERLALGVCDPGLQLLDRGAVDGRGRERDNNPAVRLGERQRVRVGHVVLGEVQRRADFVQQRGLVTLDRGHAGAGKADENARRGRHGLQVRVQRHRRGRVRRLEVVA